MNPDMSRAQEAEKELHEKISPTASVVAYLRTFSDIPYSVEIFNALESIREAQGQPEMSLQLKAPETAPRVEARYKLVNKLLEENDAEQILELAAGMSPRGIKMAEDPTMLYAEMDLPGIMKEKQAIAEAIISNSHPNLAFASGSALDLADIEHAVKAFNPEKPLFVVNEGLLRYLSFAEKAIVANNIHAILKRFGGAWITPDTSLRRATQSGVALLQHEEVKKLTHITIDENLFEDEAHAREYFEALGFSVENHPFSEVTNSLVSPAHLGLSPERVKNIIDNSAVFVMRPR
jgi:O-methyltransferase involved in polyketide biosynthesis